jgi:hypothetical protein
MIVLLVWRIKAYWSSFGVASIKAEWLICTTERVSSAMASFKAQSTPNLNCLCIRFAVTPIDIKRMVAVRYQTHGYSSKNQTAWLQFDIKRHGCSSISNGMVAVRYQTAWLQFDIKRMVAVRYQTAWSQFDIKRHGYSHSKYIFYINNEQKYLIIKKKTI